jgi:hypothetical protein
MTRGPGGPVREAAGCREGQADASELGRPGQIPEKDFNWKLIFEFQMSLNFGKTLITSTRRFIRN